MAASANPDAVTLRGPPRKLTAVVRLGSSGSDVFPVTVTLPDGTIVVRVSAKPFGGDSEEIRLEIPRHTPPGTYDGVATIGGKKRKILMVVEAEERLRVHPRQTTITAAPGARERFNVTVANIGNVPVKIPRTTQFDFEDDDDQDHALGRTLRAKLCDTETRVDRFFEELRSAHGGEAHLTVAKGAGMIEPCQTCDLTSLLDVPTTVKPGRTYTGDWDIGDTAHDIVIEVVDGLAPRVRHGRSTT